jgi:hypothetical protein
MVLYPVLSRLNLRTPASELFKLGGSEGSFGKRKFVLLCDSLFCSGARHSQLNIGHRSAQQHCIAKAFQRLER